MLYWILLNPKHCFGPTSHWCKEKKKAINIPIFDLYNSLLFLHVTPVWTWPSNIFLVVFSSSFLSIIMIFNIGGEDRCDTCCSGFLLTRWGWQSVFGHDCFVRARYSHMARAMRGGNKKKLQWRQILARLPSENYMLQDVPDTGGRGIIKLQTALFCTDALSSQEKTTALVVLYVQTHKSYLSSWLQVTSYGCVEVELA